MSIYIKQGALLRARTAKAEELAAVSDDMGIRKASGYIVNMDKRTGRTSFL